MVQIGKKITWGNITREKLSDFLGESNAKLNITWISDTEANVFGDSAELTIFQNFVSNKGTVIEIITDVPIPPQPTPPPDPTQEQIDNVKFQKKAFDEQFAIEENTFWNKVQAKYTAKGGTGTALKNGRYLR